MCYVVPVYTQFGYAQVDLDKYKDDSNITQALSNISISNNSASPEKNKDSKVSQQEEVNAGSGGGQMSQTNHDSNVSTSSTTISGGSVVGNGDKFIELQYKWGQGYIQVI